MKKLVKIFVVAAFALGFGVTAQAQIGESQDAAGMSATAKVFDVIEVTVDESLAFGQVIKGTKKSVLPSSNTPISNSNSTSNDGVKAGIFKVTAGGGSALTLDFTLPSALARTSGTGDDLAINFTQDAAGTDRDFAAWSIADDFSGQTEFDATQELNFDGTGENKFPSGGLMYVYIGGTVTAPSALAAGSFSGTITLTATYN